MDILGIDAAVAKLQAAEDEWIQRVGVVLPVVMRSVEAAGERLIDRGIKGVQSWIDSLDGWSINKPQE